MVNFLRQQPQSRMRQQSQSGNRTSDLLREHLAQSAAQRIGAQFEQRDNPQAQLEPQKPSFLMNAAPALAQGAGLALGMGADYVRQQQAQQQQADAQEELASIYAAEYDMPIERARMLASAPPETRKQILADLSAQRKQAHDLEKEEKKFEHRSKIEGIKLENNKSFADYQKEVNDKFPKDDPNRAYYKQGLSATQMLKKLSKNIPYDPQGYFDKLTYERKDEQEVKNWITMSVAAAAPIAKLNDFQRKELEQNYLEQYYTKGKRQQVVDQLEGTFTAGNFEAIQEQAAQMQQQQQQQQQQKEQQGAEQPEQQMNPQEMQQSGEEQQLEQPQQQPQNDAMEFPESPKEEGWGEWAGRAGARALGNVAESVGKAHQLTTPAGAAQMAAEYIPEWIKDPVKEYLPEFVTNALTAGATPFNPFKFLSVEELKKNPVAEKMLKPDGTLDRVVDSVTRELPEMAIAYGTGGAIIKPLVQGLMGGMSDEWLDAQDAPEVAKVAARIITSFGVSGAQNAIKDLRNKKAPMQSLTKEVRKTASGNYNKARDLGKNIYGDVAPIVALQEELAIPENTQNIKDKGAVQGLRDVVQGLFKQGHPNRAPEGTTTVGKVKFNDLTKAYKDLGELSREETNKSMKKWYDDTKDAIRDSVQLMGNQGGKALEAVNTWNAANEGWKATEQLNDFEEIVKNVATNYPGIAKTTILGVVSALLGYGTYYGPAKALTAGAILGGISGLGSAQRALSYMKRPEVQKLFIDFMDSGFSKDAAATARNYRDIDRGFKKFKGAA